MKTISIMKVLGYTITHLNDGQFRLSFYWPDMVQNLVFENYTCMYNFLLDCPYV